MIPYMQDETNKSNNKIDNASVDDFQAVYDIKWYDALLLNRPLQLVSALVLTSILAPLLIYHFIFISISDQPPSDGLPAGSCVIPREVRIVCGYEVHNASGCHPQCCFDYHNNMCFHRSPSRFSYVSYNEWTEDTSFHPRTTTVPYDSQPSLTTLKLSIDEISPTHMSITFYDPNEAKINGSRLDSKEYRYEVSTPELNVNVEASQGQILSTIGNHLVASENIWEIVLKLTTESMYGFGEIPLKPGTVKVLYNNKDSYPGVPLIFARINSSYHGVLIDVVEPTEVVIKENNDIIIRSITKIGLKLHVFVGPRPVNVMKDVMDIIGFQNSFQYWMLGAHICREFNPDETTENLKSYLDSALENQFPFDSHCGTSPILFNSNFNDEKNKTAESAILLKEYSKRFVPHLYPYIYLDEDCNYLSLSKGKDVKFNNCNIDDNDENFYLTFPNSSLYIGKAHNTHVVYPDYKSISLETLTYLIPFNEAPSGLVLENNWPLDENQKDHEETFQSLPYFSEDLANAFNNTVQWNVTRTTGDLHFYRHNEYGVEFVEAFDKIDILKDLPRWSSCQRQNGNIRINRQTIEPSWTNLRKVLVESALGGASGHWFWSSPVCGDSGMLDMETQAHLCVKWSMTATYLPMIKIIENRTSVFFSGMDRSYMTKALTRRLSLLPYFFMTLQQGPLLRPMFFQYPSEKELSDLSTQFSVGEDLLIVPNLQPYQSAVHVWLPPGTWYEIWSGLKITSEEGQPTTISTTDADFVTLVKGGSIIVTQKDTSLTAEETRQNSNFTLLVVLECVNKTYGNLSARFENSQNEFFNIFKCQASGELYMKQDMRVYFESDEKEMKMSSTGNDFDVFCGDDAIWNSGIKEIIVYGLSDDMNNVDHQKHFSLLQPLDLCLLRDENLKVFTYE